MQACLPQPKKKKENWNKTEQKIFWLPLTVRFHQWQSGNKLTANQAALLPNTHTNMYRHRDNFSSDKGEGQEATLEKVLLEYIILNII